MEDPFVSSPEGPAGSREPHRYSSFDTQLFSLNASSPSQAKRALEAHLAETERRLQEASKLGTALINQQKELSEKLQEVEQQRDEGEVGPELRQKLIELEKEYNEIGRESARAFLAPKRAVSGGDGTPMVDLRVRIPCEHSAYQLAIGPMLTSLSSHRPHLPYSLAKPAHHHQKSAFLRESKETSPLAVFMTLSLQPRFRPLFLRKYANCKDF
jgi:hypothetical protein